jgi:hypothetical protein
MIPWETTRRHPMIDVHMVAQRQFGACFLVMLATGAILLATTQFLPELVQRDFGYTATWAGLALSPGGLVIVVMMLVVGRISGHVQPKYLIALGALIIALAMHDLTRINPALDFWYFALSRMLIGVGLPLVFIPITMASARAPRWLIDGPPATLRLTLARNQTTLSPEVVHEDVYRCCRADLVGCRLLVGNLALAGGLGTQFPATELR